MLSKLALRNVKRSFKDYLIYTITITIALSLIFAFNLISNSRDILELTKMMDNFKIAMIIVSIIVILVLSYLINYTVRFMFQKRSKEFATYMILGIEKKDITKMFLLENIILGIISLVLSFFLGFLFSQFMTYAIMNIFNHPYEVTLARNLSIPILLSITYFIIIYVIVLFLSSRRIKKTKTYDLLYLEKKNEIKKEKSKTLKITIFTISILLGIIGLFIIDCQFTAPGPNPSFNLILLSSLLIILSIYGITFTLSEIILEFTLKRKKIKYKKDNLFIIRQFSSKIKTMSFTLGTLSLLVTFTFISLNVSSLFNQILDEQVNMIAPYDVTIIDEKEEFNKYIEKIKENYTIKEIDMITQYKDINNPINSKLPEKEKGWNQTDTITKLSDYNTLLRLKGLKPEQLDNKEFLIHVSKIDFQMISSQNIKEITLQNGRTLILKEIKNKKYSNIWSYGTGYIIVVPDDAINELEPYDDLLIVDTKEETDEKLKDELTKILEPTICETNQDTGASICYSAANVSVRGAVMADNKSTMTIMSFSLFYLAFIFTAVVGTILAIQALSDSTKYKYRYSVLSKLGVEDKDIYKTIKKQLIIFFVFPLIYPLLISFSVTNSLNHVFKNFLSTDNQFLIIFLVGTALFLLVYILYYLATYFSFKKNIKE